MADWWTDTTENITLLQISWRVVIIYITVCMTKYENMRMQTYITKRTGGPSAKKRTRHRGIQYSTWQTQHQRLKKMFTVNIVCVVQVLHVRN